MARESTAMMTPCWKMNPSVVVPWQGLTISTTWRSNESSCGLREAERAVDAVQQARQEATPQPDHAQLLSNAAPCTHVLDGWEGEVVAGRLQAAALRVQEAQLRLRLSPYIQHAQV